MLRHATGDILEADAEAIVNTVNCVGVMGRGLALQFRKAFPANFEAYAAACRRGEVRPGRMFVFETGAPANPKYIVNFPTKRHWRDGGRMEDIDAGLAALAEEVRRRAIRSIAVPPLGSGLGGLDWEDVRPRIEAALGDVPDLEVVVFGPNRVPAGTGPPGVPAMTPGRAALVVLMDRYLGGLMDPFVTPLEVHKLMRFMQEAGEPLRLRYAKAPHGPHAGNLAPVLRAMEGRLVSARADGGGAPDAPDTRLEPAPGAVRDAQAFLSDKPDTTARCDRVGRLVEGFETPFGLELLASVHWTATRGNAAGPDDAVAGVHAWAERKKRFSRRQIHIAFRTLRDQDWFADA